MDQASVEELKLRTVTSFQKIRSMARHRPSMDRTLAEKLKQITVKRFQEIKRMAWHRPCKLQHAPNSHGQAPAWLMD